ncbi:MAG: helix-hairpin-helix domain-containing protein [Spirochaetes bacterium]|nr:helix-hairpin-helix domain-containing protein [Spirochaetota bacterium]
MRTKQLVILLILFICLTQIHSGAFEEREPGARIASMGGSGVAFTEDIYAPLINPAGLISVSDLSALFSYYSLYPSLEEMDSIRYFNISVGESIPGLFSMALSYNYFGYEYYKESVFTVSPAFELYYQIGLGFNLKFYNLSIQDMGDASSIGIDMGVLAKISRELSIGGFMYNINSPTIGSQNEEISQYGTLGIEFVPTSGLSLNFDIQKVVDRKLNLRAGQEFRLLRYVFVRSGIQTNPTKYALGLGLSFQHMTFDYALSIHNTLGNQHIISLKFSLGKEKKLIFAEKPPKEETTAVPEVEYLGPRININTAGLEELQQLPRVGPKTAAKIIEHRNTQGPFKKIDDIQNVKGIGPKTFAKMRHIITVGGEEEGQEEKIAPMAFDLNKAQMKDFIDKGISPIIGLRIIQYREKKGVIKSVEEIKGLEGMTPEIYQKLKDLVEGK